MLTSNIQDPAAAQVVESSADAASTTKSASDLVEQARREEKAKLYAQIEHEKKRAEEARKEIESLREAEKKRKLEALPVEEQTRARIAELEQHAVRARDEMEQMRRDAEMQIRATHLVAYRERVLRDVGDRIIPHLVRGNSEEEIDASVVVAREEFERVARLVEKQRGQNIQQLAGAGHVAPPPNPAFPIQMPGGLPTPVAAPAHQVMGANQPSGVPVHNFVNENAIRSGAYSGELRQQILEQTRAAVQGGGMSSLGVQPLQGFGSPYPAQSLPAVNMPNGVMQPVGSRMGPAMNPQYQGPRPAAPHVPYMPAQFLNPMPQMPPQQVAPQMQVPQQAYQASYPQQYAQQVDPAVAEARAAVERTMAGQNPLVSHSDNNMNMGVGTQRALAEAQAFGAANGLTPDQAFANRFGS